MAPQEQESMAIAIVGMSCRFAGDATDPEKLWRMISEKRSAWSEIPSSRFNIKGVYDEKSGKLSTVRTKRNLTCRNCRAAAG